MGQAQDKGHVPVDDKGQVPVHVKGQTTCTHHNVVVLNIYCKQCQDLACIQCLSSVHDRHHVCGLEDIIPERKEDIQKFIDKAEKEDLVQIEKYITSIDAELKENASEFDKLSQEIKAQTSKLKHELDLLLDKNVSLFKQVKEDNTKLLQTYKQDLEKYRTELKQRVEEYKTALQGGSDLQIYDAGCEIHSPVKLPGKPTLRTASFAPNEDYDNYHWTRALGKVNTSGRI